MKLWFTGACLNSASFIDNICSEGFASRLDQFATQRERELCVENEFLSVISQKLSENQAFAFRFPARRSMRRIMLT